MDRAWKGGEESTLLKVNAESTGKARKCGEESALLKVNGESTDKARKEFFLLSSPWSDQQPPLLLVAATLWLCFTSIRGTTIGDQVLSSSFTSPWCSFLASVLLLTQIN
ncbi:hypothetical protein CRG98_013450 [Punica granatum]|uniref:Uncharacterized protein n=1 Tax=Punica granatum TaxID=22663 RepID=A0A2I0KCB0_PUNGR|nr:hypothetical protein CRG98_013450 [Punica granatum]